MIIIWNDIKWFIRRRRGKSGWLETGSNYWTDSDLKSI